MYTRVNKIKNIEKLTAVSQLWANEMSNGIKSFQEAGEGTKDQL